MTPLKLNYNIYNKELLGIVVVFKKWLNKTELFIKMMKKDEPWKWDNDKMRLFKEVK